MWEEEKKALLAEADKLHFRREHGKTVTPDYYEPGMMEFLEQSDGIYHAETGELELQFEVKGTRYDGRTERIETLQPDTPITLEREQDNRFNSSNFRVLTARRKDLGNVPAELCMALAPLYDAGQLELKEAAISYLEPLSRRSRHAKQAVLFIRTVFLLK